MRLYRLLVLSSLLVALTLAGAGCHKPGPQRIIRMSDLHTQKQLLRGFYDLEAGAWRWTGQSFTVGLKVPSGAQSKGAVLTLQGTIPPEAVQNAPLEINASVAGTALPVQSFTKSGELIYRADVPGSALDQGVILADFTLSSSHRVPGDLRDLGIIASVISLRSK